MPAESREVTDTVVAVTGASSGIGAATARLLLEARDSAMSPNLGSQSPSRGSCIGFTPPGPHVTHYRAQLEAASSLAQKLNNDM